MATTKQAMKMPELLLFAKSLAVGFFCAEVLRATFFVSKNLALALSGVDLYLRTISVFIGMLLCLTYSLKRNAHTAAAQIGRSFRIDLLITIGIGVWTNQLATPWLTDIHLALKSASYHWSLAVLLLLCAILLSPLIQWYWPKPKKVAPQLHFITDEEIEDDKDDILASESRAKSFADTVLASHASPGLVFGIDGPWGVGKTSFINLAERYWTSAADRVIVCRFEPLRYASEPDLADRLIRDLSAAIQRKVFVPEFRPVASRFSRLIKGKADFSFLGFKLSLEPSQETVEELLDDIDEVLKRINRRVIIVIDDLDRLDAKTINNVLFATRRTFKLSQATYILCYDTEVLAGNMEDGEKAREFLEKFVTVKLSLFVDSSSIRDFLRINWQRPERQLGAIPSDRMVRLGKVLNELANILDSELAANYLPLVGNLRKVKRFVNSMLLMEIENINFDRSDFNPRDLINLILLHLNYPGIFRNVYAQETEGRSGAFSVGREYGKPNFKNSPEFTAIMNNQGGPAHFLLSQLFDVTTLKLDARTEVEESVLASRACFNEDGFRNLEKYLKRIVRFVTPEPQTTFVLYQDAVQRVRSGTPIGSVLASSYFQLELGEHSHDQFWRILVNQSHDFTDATAEHAINTLIDYLPRYSSVDNGDRGLRQRSIYSLLLLLDRAGWKTTSSRRKINSADNIVKIAQLIFGQNSQKNDGVLQRLSARERGVLGWNDLMLFRLSCSADRQGQLFNLHSALLVYEDINAVTTGLVSGLAVMGMRRVSQQVFALFKKTYIENSLNFFKDVHETPADVFLGEALVYQRKNGLADTQLKVSDALLGERVDSEKSVVKSFVIYQLTNRLPPNGSGVGCGFYDEKESGDQGEIARLMNDYIFDICFNPEIHEDNIFYFLDHCLSHLSNSFLSSLNEEGYIATKSELPGGFDPKRMGQYWIQHQTLIRQRVLNEGERYVVTPNYKASYSQDLPKVFTVLDELAE